MSDKPVLVTGPAGSGTEIVAAALCERLPQRVITRSRREGCPATIVFVLSAAAAPVPSDWATLEEVAEGVRTVIGVVVKTDLHPQWPSVLAAARRNPVTVGQGRPRIPWVAVPSCIDSDGPELNELAGMIGAAADKVEPVHEPAWAPHGAQAPIPARIRIGQARLRLRGIVRNRCVRARMDLRREASKLSRSELGLFPNRVRARISRESIEIGERMTAEFAAVERAAGLPGSGSGRRSPPQAQCPVPLSPRRSPERGMAGLLAAGFGMGVTLSLSRAVGQLTAAVPSIASTLSTACAVVGLITTGWVMRTRALLADRAMLQRWALDAVTALQFESEQAASLRALAVESAIICRL